MARLTKERLVKMVFDNEEMWSCPSPCPYNDDEEHKCEECAEEIVDEYINELIGGV